MKKILALLLSAMMVVALVGASLAEDSLPTAEIKIVGLETGDEVSLYQVIGWDTTAGNWAVLAPFTTVSTNVDDFVGSNMNAAKAAAIAACVTDSTTTAPAGSISDDTFTATEEVGMYLALVKAGGEFVYNPMILSVNWDGQDARGSELSGIDSSDAYGTIGRAKKTPVDFDKEVEDIGEDAKATTDGDTWFTVTAGDEIPFKVTSTVPAYAENYDDPYYAISDTLSTGLTLDEDTITVTVGETVIIEDGVVKIDADIDAFTHNSSSFSVSLSASFLHSLSTNAPIEITYKGTVGDFTDGANVTKLDNEAKIEFSNNPHDEDDHEVKYDRTHHYTFAVDADATGTDGGSWITSELVKIGVKDGETVEEWKITDEGAWESKTKLAEAVFRLKGKAGTTTADYDVSFTTGSTGHISFYNLEAGEYELTEVSAPAGYVKSDEVCLIKIETTMKDNEVTIDGYTFTEKILDTYTIKMSTDGGTTWNVKDTYTVTNEGTTTHTTQDAANLTHPFINTEGLELPSTGGIGTTIFYVAGLLMVLGAGTVLVARRKADEE